MPRVERRGTVCEAIRVPLTRRAARVTCGIGVSLPLLSVELFMAWPLFVLGVLGLSLTIHAWRPLRAPGPVAVVSFFVSWLTTELSLYHSAWLGLLVVAAIAKGW